MKSEPQSPLDKSVDGKVAKFGAEDLKVQLKQTACWSGVPSYQSCYCLTVKKLEEKTFFYSSNCKDPRKT